MKIGEILPPSKSNLTLLSYLNLSYTNLSGRVPTNTQLQSFNPSSFIGNSLYGPPKRKVKRKLIRILVSIGNIVVGFGVGFLGVIAPFLFCRIWRVAYFWFFQEYLCFIPDPSLEATAAMSQFFNFVPESG
ncbi:hypothetical protein G4B88_028967 [Cannabis sativa]|uniref:Uncharacterized protein n=1 Tax=Cannabis sativa TaxID=3483 RepID=A0A7J6HN46_CANSA|nr:hypothetical protein G4B88_028967 [Cannabis sativa]